MNKKIAAYVGGAALVLALAGVAWEASGPSAECVPAMLLGSKVEACPTEIEEQATGHKWLGLGRQYNYVAKKTALVVMPGSIPRELMERLQGPAPAAKPTPKPTPKPHKGK